MSNNAIKLSYIITTRNKLAFLRESLSRLAKNIASDEEIIVVDGASNDGTGEYLRGALERGEIHQLISEPDAGEAHGFNKGVLRARGELIKLITDDDVFYFPSINLAKKYMLTNDDVDILFSDGLFLSRENGCLKVFHWAGLYRFHEWRTTGRPFHYNGLGIMLRRASLPLLGLFHPCAIIIDIEYSLRVSSLKARIAWMTSTNYVHVLRPQSNSVTLKKRYDDELERLYQFYRESRDAPEILASLRQAGKAILKAPRRVAGKVARCLGLRAPAPIFPPAAFFQVDDFELPLDQFYDKIERWLARQTTLEPPQIISGRRGDGGAS
jgi:glycosyltransferase involved in cell wall biosynthesis